MAHVHKPSIKEAEGRGRQVQSQTRLCSKNLSQNKTSKMTNNICPIHEGQQALG